MKKRVLAVILLITIAIVGCGKMDRKTASNISDKKKESVVEKEMDGVVDAVSEKEDKGTEEELVEAMVEEVASESSPVEQVQTEKTKKSEQKKTQTKAEAPAVTTPVVSEPVATTPEPEVKVEECSHWYQPVEVEEYHPYIYEMKWGCNGCGYPLYDILEDGTAVNFSDMYSHPPCETDRYDEPCTGGGFHSELYYSGRCYECHSKIIMRSCTYFYVMAERCMKNAGDFGEYEKVEDGCAYIKSCDCGKNLLVSGGQTGGLMVKKEVCTYCGDTKTYPEK